MGFKNWFLDNWDILLVGAIPVILSLVAIFFSWRSVKWEKHSAEAAARSATAAERANLLTERLLQREHLVEPAATEPGKVSWQITNPSGSVFVLRNTGSDVAEDVNLEIPSGIPRNIPKDAIVKPGDAVEFFVAGRYGSPKPHTIYATWRGQDEPQAIPMP